MTDETADERMRRLLTAREVRPLPRRFYTSVTIRDDHAVLLDGKPIKTPMKALLCLPNRALAEAIASEWAAQEKVINPALMPLTKYANTAIDRAVSERDSVLDELARYAGSDLVCYRAATPQSLIALQDQHWDPVLTFATEVLDASFLTATGVVHVAQPPQSIAAVRSEAAKLDPFRLTALYNLTSLMGSALLPMMLLRRAITSDEAWTAAHVDEDFQIALWGEDEEARARRAARRQEFDGLVLLFNLLDKA